MNWVIKHQKRNIWKN